MAYSYREESYLRNCANQAQGCAEIIASLKALAEQIPENGKRFKAGETGPARVRIANGEIHLFAPTRGFEAIDDEIPCIIDYKAVIDRGVIRDRERLLDYIGKRVTLWETYRKQAEQAESRLAEYRTVCEEYKEAYDKLAKIAREMPETFVRYPDFTEIYK